jgi:tetratricopeptide (TPR) repeat protein
MRNSRTALAIVAVVAFSAWCKAQTPAQSGSGRAGTTEERALALFQQGRALLQSGHPAEACLAFESSRALSPTIGTLLNLGLCHRALGRLATALQFFRKAEALSAENGDGERQARAASDAEELQRLVGTLMVRVVDTDLELRVVVDGLVLERSKWGMAVPMDAGPHEVHASSTALRSFQQAVVVHDGAPSFVIVTTVPPSAGEPPPIARTNAPQSVGASKEGAASPGTTTPPTRVAAYVIAGAGVASLGVGLAFGLAAWANYSAAEAACPSHKGCLTPDASGHYDTAVTDATVANVASIAGLAALGAGVALYFVHGESRSDSAPHVALVAAPHGAAAGITGSF